jgi:hypothetical protein
VNPRTRAALIEAAISLATTALLLAALRYGPDLYTAARARLTRPPAPGEDELAVSDFRMGLGGQDGPDLWAGTSTGWEHEDAPLVGP